MSHYPNPSDIQGDPLDDFILLDSNDSDYRAHLFAFTVSYAFRGRRDFSQAALRVAPRRAGVRGLRDATGLSFPAASSGMDLLGNLGIARELTGKRRNRLFVDDRYLGILNKGTELP